MSPKPSETSVRANELAAEISAMIANGYAGIWGLHWKDLTLLRALTWRRLSKTEQDFVVLKIQGDSLWISVYDKPKRQARQTRQGTLIALLRRCMVHIDDEKLYDEVMEVVHDKQKE